MLGLQQIADMLDAAPRYGASPGRAPGAPIGAKSVAADSGATDRTDRYVRLSDAVAREIAESLRRHAAGESPRALPVERR